METYAVFVDDGLDSVWGSKDKAKAVAADIRSQLRSEGRKDSCFIRRLTKDEKWVFIGGQGYLVTDKEKAPKKAAKKAAPDGGKAVLTDEQAATLKEAAKILRRLNRKAKAWSGRIDAMSSEKEAWAAEVARFHEWADAVEKKTGTVLAACVFSFRGE